jgi:hypothetical protein
MEYRLTISVGGLTKTEKRHHEHLPHDIATEVGQIGNGKIGVEGPVMSVAQKLRALELTGFELIVSKVGDRWNDNIAKFTGED